MVKIENLSVAFEGAEVVKNVSIEIGKGEIVGVVGESGSGKSITSLTLMGLAPESAQVTEGRIVFDGVVLREAGCPFDRKRYQRYQGAQMSMISGTHDILKPDTEGWTPGGGGTEAAHEAFKE